jgi:hypothetical protein
MRDRIGFNDLMTFLCHFVSTIHLSSLEHSPRLLQVSTPFFWLKLGWVKILAKMFSFNTGVKCKSGNRYNAKSKSQYLYLKGY